MGCCRALAASFALVLTGCYVPMHRSAATPSEAMANASVASAGAEPTAGGASAETTADPGEPDLGTSGPDDHADATPGEGLPPGNALDTSGLAVASKYARLDRTACEAELNARHVPFERVGEARGVLAPLRLTGPIRGITFRSSLPAAQRKKSLMEIYDCRLVLALDDFAKMLAKHDIVEVIHMSVYRPAPAKTLKTGLGRRHGGALAIDAGFFKTKDGQTLSVERDFHGRIGARPCPASAKATELQKIACEANDARLFNVLLTPDYNWAHRNHFHLEVTAGVRWTLVR